MGFYDSRITLADLVQRPVLLVHEVVHVIQAPEFVDDVGADKVGIRHFYLFADVGAYLRVSLLQNLPGEIHTGRFSANLAAADAPLVDLAQVGNAKDLFGDADIR